MQLRPVPLRAVAPGWVAAPLALTAAAVLWHLALPERYYGDAAVFLEGPLPAVAGAGLGLWIHRHSPAWFAALAGCAFATFALLSSALVLGTLLFGPITALLGAWGTLRAVWPQGLLLLPQLWGTPFGLYVAWVAVKSLLVWGALGYLVALFLHGDGRARPAQAWLLGAWRDLTQGRAFRRHQRQQLREYRQLYLDALKQGAAPPAPPAGLLPGAAAGDGARSAYWLLRIGLLLAGAVSAALFWAAVGDELQALARRAAWPFWFR